MVRMREPETFLQRHARARHTASAGRLSRRDIVLSGWFYRQASAVNYNRSCASMARGLEA